MLEKFNAFRRRTLAPSNRIRAVGGVLIIIALPTIARAGDQPLLFSDYQLRLSQDAVLHTIADAKLRLATAEFLPRVSIGGDWVVGGRIRYSPDVTAAAPDSYAKRDPSVMGVEVSWKLFDGFQNINNRAAAQESLSYAIQASLDTRQKLLLEKAERILGIIRDRAVLKAYADAVTRRKQAYDISTKMLNEGSMTRSQVELAGAELQGAKAARLQAESALKISELEYTKFSGVALSSNTHLDIPNKRLPQTPQDASNRALAQSPQLKMAYHVEQEAEYRARAADGKFLPTVSLVGRYSRTFDASPLVDRVDNAAVLVRATIPIFDPTIGPARDVAHAEASQRRYDRQDVSLSLATEARRQHQLFQSFSAQLGSLKQQISQSRSATDAVSIEIDTGERTITDLLDAQDSLLTATVTYADARYSRGVAAFRLLATMGDLSDLDVGMDVRQF